MKKKVLLKAPILSQSGYGEHARFVYRALKQQEDVFDIYVEPLNWGQTGWVWEDSEERRSIDQSIGKFYQVLQQKIQNHFDLCVHVDLPTAWKRVAPTMIGVTAGIECDAISPSWLQPSFGEVDKIVVPSEFSKEGFLNSIDKYREIFDPNTRNQLSSLKEQLQNKISVVHYPVRDYQKVDLDLNFETDFNFLVVSQWGPRKNIADTIKMFYKEFANDADVGLVVKTNLARNAIPDRFHVKKRLEQIKEEFRDAKCKVYLLHGEMSHDEIHSLYVHPKIKAMINFGHGEGYGLPLFEAAYCGLPVITHDFGGQKDFLYADVNGKKKALFTKVPYDVKTVQVEAIWQGIIEPDAEWAFVKPYGVKTAMREHTKDYGRFKGQANKLKENIINHHSNNLYENFFYSLGVFNKKVYKEPKEVNGISFCISTNSKNLDKLKKSIKSIKNTNKNSSFKDYEINIAGIVKDLAAEDNINLIEANYEAKNGLLAKLRNIAAANCKFENIVFLDDDIIFEEDWTEKFLKFSKEKYWDVLGNKILLPDGSRYWDRSTTYPHTMVEYDYPENDRRLYQTGCFWIIRKEVFDKHKWDSNIRYYAEKDGKTNEDVEYSSRLMNEGYCLSFDSNNLVWHLDGRYTEQDTLDGRKICVRHDVENTFSIKDFSYLED